jgi:hypothetical protein
MEKGKNKDSLFYISFTEKKMFIPKLPSKNYSTVHALFWTQFFRKVHLMS